MLRGLKGKPQVARQEFNPSPVLPKKKKKREIEECYGRKMRKVGCLQIIQDLHATVKSLKSILSKIFLT
jgi:hypothetical protein